MNNMRWKSLDCLKGISCLAVICIHYHFTGGNIPTQVGLIMKSICRFAVPIFFCISGFFGSDILPDKYIHKIQSTFKLLLGAGLFYAVFALFWHPLMYADWSVSKYIADTITGTSLIKFFLTQDPFEYAHLWYLLALINCYGLMLLLRDRVNIYILATGLLIGYSCMQEFKILPSSISIAELSSRIYVYNSFLFRALPFFLCGMIFRKNLLHIQALPLRKSYLFSLTIIGCIISAFEGMRFGDCQFYIGSYLSSFAMLIYAFKYPDASSPLLYHIGKDLSMLIYILHIAVGKSMDLVGKYVGLWGKDIWYITRPMLVFCISLFLAELIFQVRCAVLTKKRKVK